MTSWPYTEMTAAGAGATTRARPHIVVGVDGGIGGWMALAWARDEAIATAGRLTLCHAGPPPAGVSTTDALTLADPPLSRAVHDVRQRLGGERVDVRFAPGDAVGLIVEAAAEADLVVVGPPLHGGPFSTALRTAASSPRPVVIVRPGQDEPRLPFAGHVVAAIGGGPCDTAVATLALRYAATHDLPVAAVHITERGPNDYWFDEDTLETHFATEPPEMALLARVVEPLRSRFPHVPMRLFVLGGSPGPRLIAATGAARLIVAGRGHRRPPAAALGGTSAALVRNAVPTVVVVPPPGTGGSR
jgi:nucleotide-binding universal stress UspA family protein